MKKFDPDQVGLLGSLFGFPYSLEDADLIVLPVPWEVTVSYGSGTSLGPQSILEASAQLDFSMYSFKKPWKFKTAMEPVSEATLAKSNKLREISEQIIRDLELGRQIQDNSLYEMINSGCREMVDEVYESSGRILDSGKVCAVLGGDHSTPLGLIEALAERHAFGILQVDAHMDLRESYEGFKYSHASIMYNALQLEGVQSLMQVGIRDFSQSEREFASNCDKPVQVFYDDHVKEGMLIGDSWSDWVSSIIAMLPEKVYVSFDIDGLEPSLCPNTGTPVPGGLSFEQANFLLLKLARSGRKIIGFDLCEVAPGKTNWDANVGARILYRLCTYTGLSHGKITTSI